MRKSIHPLMLIAALMSTALFSFNASSDVKIKAELDRTRLIFGERATLTVTLEGENIDTRKGVEIPQLEPFFVIVNQSGPQIQKSMQIINGRFTSSSSWTMTYILEARNTGIFQIPPLVHRVGNRIYKTDPINVEIIEPPEVKVHDQSEWAPPADPYLEARVDKKQAYVGEQVVVSWYLYNRISIDNLRYGSPPTLAEFKVEELERARQLDVKTKSFNGIQYRVAFIQSIALFPLKDGKTTIGPLELIYEIPTRQVDFFGRRIMKEQSITSSPVAINILPLPQQGMPDNFSGAVGEFSIQAGLDKNRVRALNSLNLQIKIAGTGNIEFLKPPELNLPPSIEVYPPEIDTDSSVREGKLFGTKLFKYILVPQEKGEFILPGVSFSFFEPSAKGYRTIQNHDLSLKVEPAPLRAGRDVALSPDLTREEVKLLSQDLRYIKPDREALKEEGKYLALSPFYLGLHAVPVLAIAAAFYYRKRRDKLEADPRLARTKQAHPLAKKRLRKAKKLLQEDKPGEFYAELSSALSHYFADRFQLEAPGLTSEKIERIMKQKNISQESRDRFLQILSLCDRARFSKAAASLKDMQQAYKEALKIISELEKAG